MNHRIACWLRDLNPSIELDNSLIDMRRLQTKVPTDRLDAGTHGAKQRCENGATARSKATDSRFAWKARVFRAEQRRRTLSVRMGPVLAEIHGEGDLNGVPGKMANKATRCLHAMVCNSDVGLTVEPQAGVVVLPLEDHLIILIEGRNLPAASVSFDIARMDLMAYHWWAYGMLLISGREQLNLGPVKIEVDHPWDMLVKLIRRQESSSSI